MPVDDQGGAGGGSGVLTQQNSGSSGLSVEAAEFVPRFRSQERVEEVNSNGAGRYTGTVPKSSSGKFYNDNRRNGGGRSHQENPRRNNQLPPRLSQHKNESEMTGGDRKFFKDNQKYSRQSENERGGGGFRQNSRGSRNNNENVRRNDRIVNLESAGGSLADVQSSNGDTHGGEAVRAENKTEDTREIRDQNGNSRPNQESSRKNDDSRNKNHQSGRNPGNNQGRDVNRGSRGSRNNNSGPARNDYGWDDDYRGSRSSKSAYPNDDTSNPRRYQSGDQNFRGSRGQDSKNNRSGESNQDFRSSRNDKSGDPSRDFQTSSDSRSGNSSQDFRSSRNADQNRGSTKNPRNSYYQDDTRSSRNSNQKQSRWESEDTSQRNPPRYPKNAQKSKKENSVEPSMINQREQLIKDIENNKLECLICCDRIRDYQFTWSCSNCFHILHLNCIKTWIKNSKTESGEWRCPACQFQRREMPKEYFCFCGKVKSPAVNRNDLAHSCGEVCGRTDNCTHPCTLLCHPGPHAVCQSVIERVCGCGKTRKTYQCSMRDSFECESTCEKTLNCGVHKCLELCHQGDCKSCTEAVPMTCHCGKSSKTEVCGPETALLTTFSCNQDCDRMLSCENHKCGMVCHSGACAECKLLPKFVLTCPCGRSKVPDGQREICTDEIPLCKAICGKLLKCGPLAAPHPCPRPCHVGECPPCSKTTNVRCRCGRIEEKIACKDLTSTDVRCKNKCKKFKTCGKHKCNQNCCIELEHLCNQQCGRNLECKKHRCQLPCHIGNCLQCPRVSFDELRCECGAAVVYPPVPCGTRPPDCSRNCTRTHPCTHPVNHLCHSEAECPPCVFLTTKFCYGKHEQRKTIPCNQESFSCGMPCGIKVKCGRHNCIKKCHLGNCEKPTDVCKQLCTVKRLECEHNCNAQCHDGSCPDKPCKMMVEATCACGNLKEMKTCEQVMYENKKIQRVKLALQMQQQQQEDGFMDLKDITGDAGKKTLKILECNDECATLERNRRLDIAFKVENPNLISYPKFVPNYSEFVRGFYKKDPPFVNMVYEKLTELVKLAKESKQKSRSHSFPVMNREKRHVVHDLAAMFGAETQAYDAEPNRNVVATASRESCWLPSLSVSEVLARETGLRQVRPPPNLIKK